VRVGGIDRSILLSKIRCHEKCPIGSKTAGLFPEKIFQANEPKQLSVESLHGW
jgi:hypothetical protein